MEAVLNLELTDSGPLPGAENMALDAALMEAAAQSGRPQGRVYAWARPTLSLGYFQRLEQVAELGELQEMGVDVVQRITGGGAILHQHELTLALALPAGHPWAKLAVNACYLQLTQPLVDALRGLGVEAGFRGEAPTLKAPNCFAGSACADVVVAGKKLFGSAQRRKGEALLLHGSLLMDIDQELWSRVFGERVGLGYTSLRALGQPLSYPELSAALRRAYEAALGTV